MERNFNIEDAPPDVKEAIRLIDFLAENGKIEKVFYGNDIEMKKHLLAKGSVDPFFLQNLRNQKRKIISGK